MIKKVKTISILMSESIFKETEIDPDPYRVQKT